MPSCTSSDTLTRRKYQRVPQNLDNPKNGWGDGGFGSLAITVFLEDNFQMCIECSVCCQWTVNAR